MSTQLRERLPMTAEELAGPGVPEKFVELIEGELVEMVVRGWRCSEIAFSVAMIFHGFCKNRPDLDFASANTGVHIRKSPDTVLAPDASLFYSRPHKSEMWIEFAPEVVVEVCSPNNSRAETLLRRRLYFDAGTQQFWGRQSTR
ncbi:MAG: Uma2 family endonuclease [Candidatus Hydrogenedentes bacterium]|nr:Uma2 family endonuclease [Candidatus Hydrogenedentota bacterium]